VARFYPRLFKPRWHNRLGQLLRAHYFVAQILEKISEPGGHGSLKGVLCMEPLPDCVLNIAR
jgi:hypothetical protein